MSAILETRDVHKTFGAVVAAQALNVAIEPGSFVSLIGANGAGKTSFVNIVTGYVKPDRGHVLFDGRDITKLSPRAITHFGVARSFQMPQLFLEFTVLQNLLVAVGIAEDRGFVRLKSAARAEAVDHAEAILDRFQLGDYRDHLASELPGGVRKLVDIAMAMTSHPRVMLLDEPTSGVADEEKYPLMDQVMGALEGAEVTAIFVEHDMDIVTRYAQRVLAFSEGRIIADDAPDAVIGDPEVQRYVTGTAE